MPLDEPAPEQPGETAVYAAYDPTEQDPLTDAETSPETPAPEPAEPSFDERYREDLHGLLFLGALLKKFSWLGHDFVIRTLQTGEYAEVALVAARYRDTDFAARAYQAATVAACLVSVDGQDLPVMPLTNEPNDTNINARFEYVIKRWFPPVMDRVYTEFYELEVRQRQVLEEMGKRSG